MGGLEQQLRLCTQPGIITLYIDLSRCISISQQRFAFTAQMSQMAAGEGPCWPSKSLLRLV